MKSTQFGLNLLWLSYKNHLFFQVNKQGMADRVVDDSNPEARLSSKEIQKLICDDEDDPPPNSWDLGAALQDLQTADPGKEFLIFLDPTAKPICRSIQFPEYCFLKPIEEVK